LVLQLTEEDADQSADPILTVAAELMVWTRTRLKPRALTSAFHAGPYCACPSVRPSVCSFTPRFYLLWVITWVTRAAGVPRHPVADDFRARQSDIDAVWCRCAQAPQPRNANNVNVTLLLSSC